MKIICIVQARMGSERLPGKVMKDLLGKPMIEYTLTRLKCCKYIDDIILATTDKEEDDILAKYVSNLGYNVFRGSENDVLKRYKDTNDLYEGDVVIRVTGDCPLIDSVVVDNVITYFLANTYDYIRLDVPDTFVRGLDTEVFSKEALDKVYSIVSQKGEDIYKEHVTLYMYRHLDEFNVGLVKGNELYNKDYRLCVDTIEDFKLVESMYKHFGDVNVCSKDIIKYLDNNNKILINKNISQKRV